MRPFRTCCALSLALALLAALTACGARSPEGMAETGEPRGKVYYTYFDTVSYVYDYAGDSAERFEDRSAEVSHILLEYHQLFDIYHEYSGVTNLCSVNKAAGGEALEVDQRLIDFMLYAREMYARTGGEMNVMLGAVTRLWHDCREAASKDPATASVPTAEQLAQAAAHTDFSLLEIDEEKRTLRISDPAASLDVGALGKGYATERAAEYLERDGAAGYVLNIGGNIRTIGTRPDGSGWVTAIRDPSGEAGEFAARLRISDTACVTSGVYERYFTVDGRRYHHIVDVDTLQPADYFSSLTIVTRDSALADALSTALFCMPYEQGLQLLQGLDSPAEALWIFPDGEMRSSPGFSVLLSEES